MKRWMISLAIVAVLLAGAAAYSSMGGPEPTQNMGSFASFSFYGNGNGNAAVQWMQPGTAPANPWDEFWFDPLGNFNLPGGLNTGGPANAGSPLTGSVETPVAQFYCSDSNGTTVLCGEITLQMTNNVAGSLSTSMNWYTVVNGVLTKKTTF
ncbi:MAG: hypothetical protein ACP5SH_12955 [Syntrophobacteraceae bacterium]